MVVAPVRLGLLHAGSLGVVHVFVGDLECICMKVSRDLPHTCSCTWCLFKTKLRKQTNGSTGFKNKGAPKIY